MNFIKSFAVFTILLFLGLYSFVVAVDPYNKLGINVFGFETKAVDFPRVNKFNQLEHSRKQYEAFIFGSSAAHRYHTSTIKELTGLEAYNYAVQSATPEDYLAMFNHVVTKFRPKLVIISADFYGLNRFQKTDEMFFHSPLREYLTKESSYVETSQGPPSIFNKTYFTLEAIRDSFKVVWVNLFGKSRHAYLEDGNYFYEAPTNKPVKINNFGYPPYEFDEKRIAIYKTIRARAEKLGIRLVVFTAPLSYEHVQRIEANPLLRERLAEFKSILRSIFGKVEDFNNESMRDFNTPKEFHDSMHPTKEYSELVLRKVLTTP
jgi:hypothetical protein